MPYPLLSSSHVAWWESCVDASDLRVIHLWNEQKKKNEESGHGLGRRYRQIQKRRMLLHHHLSHLLDRHVDTDGGEWVMEMEGTHVIDHNNDLAEEDHDYNDVLHTRHYVRDVKEEDTDDKDYQHSTHHLDDISKNGHDEAVNHSMDDESEEEHDDISLVDNHNNHHAMILIHDEEPYVSYYPMT